MALETKAALDLLPMAMPKGDRHRIPSMLRRAVDAPCKFPDVQRATICFVLAYFHIAIEPVLCTLQSIEVAEQSVRR
jgi:hypothetical protein